MASWKLNADHERIYSHVSPKYGTPDERIPGNKFKKDLTGISNLYNNK